MNSDGIKFHQSELIEYIKEADAVIVGLESISEDVLNKCPDLKIISKFILYNICIENNLIYNFFHLYGGRRENRTLTSYKTRF